MAERPLLVFPRAESVKPPKGSGFPPTRLPGPNPVGQAERIRQQFEDVQAAILAAPVDTDKVLVLETIGQLAGFQKAAEKVGMEWLAEIDADLDLDDVKDLYPDADAEAQKSLEKGGMRLYLAVSDSQAINRLLGLWNRRQSEGRLSRPYGAWEGFFKYLKDLRLWGYKDMLHDSGILQQWEDDLKGDVTSSRFEVELHFRRSVAAREQAEKNVKEYVIGCGGELLSDPIVLEPIGFHAMKVSMPAEEIRRYLGGGESLPEINEGLSPDHIKYCRPMSIAGEVPSDLLDKEADVQFDLPDIDDSLPPVIALFDGVPFSQHAYLGKRIELDDPDGYAARYQANENRHGTAMASLICHADFNAENSERRTLPRKVYVRPVLAPNGQGQEEFDDSKFPEDITERAVRRLFASDNDQDPVAKEIRVVNLSLGNAKKIFQREMSPWARLLDWLSWEYKVLFIVSAGNHVENFQNTAGATPESVISYQNAKQRFWRILSPAESINSVTVGALNADSCPPNSRIPGHLDLMRTDNLPAVYSRLGSGYRGQIKPDILVPGGKMYYDKLSAQSPFYARENSGGQGLSHAVPDPTLKRLDTSSGTSGAAALASHASGHIFEVLEALRTANPQLAPQFDALLIKALLVHGARTSTLDMEKYKSLKNASKRYLSRFVGYGKADFSRVEECTKNRVTVLGFGEIQNSQRHIFSLPFPNNLVNASEIRLTATLAWFSPINPFHHAFRRAKLSFEILKNHGIGLKRCGSDWQQVRKGTLQHEVFEIQSNTGGKGIEISIDCKPDSGQALDDSVPYGLAITLETADPIDIYNAIAEFIAAEVPTP